MSTVVDVEGAVGAMRERHRAAAADVPYTDVRTLRIGRDEVTSTGPASPVIDPATGEQWGAVPEATADEVDAAVRAARAAFPAWAAL
ncbi:aldehyde dehydrogenase family protein, partial [Microbacterium aurantiacum]